MRADNPMAWLSSWYDNNSAVEESAKGTTNVATNTSDLVKEIDEISNAMNDNRQIAGNLTEEAERFVQL